MMYQLAIFAIINSLFVNVFCNWSPDGKWNSLAVDENEQKKSGEVVEAILSGERGCFGRRCLDGDQCCKGSACIDIDGTKLGTCLPIYGRSEGQTCNHDTDCSNELKCLDTGNDVRPRSCQSEFRDMKKKQYNDECVTSDECDVSKKLCCQLQRRHRMAPRRVCYYFADPKSCIGTFDSSHIKPLHYIPNSFFKARMG